MKNYLNNRFAQITAIGLVVFAVMATVSQAAGQDRSMAATQNAESETSLSGGGDGQIIASKRLIEVIRNGGPLMIPIGLCSFVLLVFVFERAVSLRKTRIIPKPFVKRFLQQLNDGEIDRQKALELCEKNRSHVATVFAAAVKKWGKTSVEIEQAVLDSGERVANDLRKYLRLINGIATVCPLLGLLGTVLGMIHAFDAIASVDPTQADPKVLIATGISQALLTTAAGMTVAIPAIIAYLYFVGRVDQRVVEIDALGQKIVNAISAEALDDQTNSSRRRAKTGKPARNVA